MSITDVIAVVSFVLTLFAIPAMMAVHKTRTRAIIQEESGDIVTAAHQKAMAHVETAIEKERERSKELFAAKHEMSEMRGLVNQLVHNTSKLDEKLDRMHELLLQLAKSR